MNLKLRQPICSFKASHKGDQIYRNIQLASDVN